MRTRTSKGPAASEEASQHPMFFETLEYREQNPERELFPSAREEDPSVLSP
jgi:hypothetical protein